MESPLQSLLWIIKLLGLRMLSQWQCPCLIHSIENKTWHKTILLAVSLLTSLQTEKSCSCGLCSSCHSIWVFSMGIQAPPPFIAAGSASRFFFLSQDRIFLCSLGYPWTCSDSPTSASGVVRLWPCIIILGLMWCWDKIRALCILGKLSINWDTSQSWREHILFQLILLMIIIYEVGIILLLIYQW